MNQIPKNKETIGEIHVDRMHFCILSKHPQYSEHLMSSKKTNIEKNLFEIFKKYP